MAPEADPGLRVLLRSVWKATSLESREVLAAYRVHDRSQSFARSARAGGRDREGHFPHFRSTRLPPEIARARPEAMSNRHIIAARLHLRSSRYPAALRHT